MRNGGLGALLRRAPRAVIPPSAEPAFNTFGKRESALRVVVHVVDVRATNAAMKRQLMSLHRDGAMHRYSTRSKSGELLNLRAQFRELEQDLVDFHLTKCRRNSDLSLAKCDESQLLP